MADIRAESGGNWKFSKMLKFLCGNISNFIFEIFNVLIHFSNLYNIILFQKHQVYLLHIESRSSPRAEGKYEFVVECAPGGDLKSAIQNLQESSAYMKIISRDYVNKLGKKLSVKIVPGSLPKTL